MLKAIFTPYVISCDFMWFRVTIPQWDLRIWTQNQIALPYIYNTLCLTQFKPLCDFMWFHVISCDLEWLFCNGTCGFELRTKLRFRIYITLYAWRNLNPLCDFMWFMWFGVVIPQRDLRIRTWVEIPLPVILNTTCLRPFWPPMWFYVIYVIYVHIGPQRHFVLWWQLGPLS